MPEEKCMYCGGTGRIMGTVEKCKYCNGSGVETEEKEVLEAAKLIKNPWEKEHDVGWENLSNFEEWFVDKMIFNGDNRDEVYEKVSSLPTTVLCAMSEFKLHIVRECFRQLKEE